MAKRRGTRTSSSSPELDAELEELLDRVMRIGPNPKLPIIIPYKPDPVWLWTRWSGTILQSTWRPTLYILLLGVSFVAAIHRDQNTTWRFTAVPSQDHALVVKLKALEAMWGYMLSFATFIISFFTSQAYGFWLATKGNVRKIQGRLNDLGMLLATHAERDETGGYTPRAQELIQGVARHVRMHRLAEPQPPAPRRVNVALAHAVPLTLRTQLFYMFGPSPLPPLCAGASAAHVFLVGAGQAVQG
jgi:hypothetical protein